MHNSVSKIVTYDLNTKTLNKIIDVPYGPRSHWDFHPCKHSNGFYLLSDYRDPSTSSYDRIVTGYVDLTTSELILAPEGVFSHCSRNAFHVMTDVDILVRGVDYHGCFLYYFDVEYRAWDVRFVPLPDFCHIHNVLLQKLHPDGHVKMSICYQMSNYMRMPLCILWTTLSTRTSSCLHIMMLMPSCPPPRTPRSDVMPRSNPSGNFHISHAMPPNIISLCSIY